MPTVHPPIHWKPAFIVGAPRSGTTLLASILARHSELCIPPETHFFRTYTRRFNCLSELIFSNNRHKTLVSFLMRNIRIKDLELSETEILNKFLGYPPHFNYLLASVIETYSEQQGKIQALEKTPHHLEYVDDIINLFPNAKIIHIVRDGRDVSTSLMNVPWSHKNIYRHAAYWAWCIRSAKKYTQLYPDNLLTIKFEDLISNPHLIIQNICRFMNINFEESMLDTTILVDTVPDWEKQWKDDSLKKPSNSKISQWKSHNPILINKIQKLMKNELVSHGYPLINLSTPNNLQDLKNLIIWNRYVFSFHQKLSQIIKKIFFEPNSFRSHQLQKTQKNKS